MPHDKNGTLLNVGDRVSVEFEVTGIHMAEEYCNTTLKIPGEHGPHNVTSTLVVNAKQTTKIAERAKDDLSVGEQRPDPYPAPGGIGNE